VSESCTVLIAAPELLPALKKRTSGFEGELLAFADTEALRALEVISRRRPRVVALERAFAATPRGAALINRIKADPTLTGSEVRIVSHDSDDSRVVSAATSGHDTAGEGPASVAAVPASGVGAPPAVLDQRGTRRAPRFKMPGGLGVIADGNIVTIIDLSTVGAQIVSATVMKPRQKLRLTIADEQATLRFNAAVAWAKFEIPPESGPRYRAGIEFVDVNAADLDLFRIRHC
jgi:PilZ domain-containing protein